MNGRTKEATYIRYWWLVGILGLPLKLKMAQTIIIQKRRNRSGRNHGKQTQFSWTELNEIHSQSHIQHQQQYRPQHEHHQRALVDGRHCQQIVSWRSCHKSRRRCRCHHRHNIVVVVVVIRCRFVNSNECRLSSSS